MRAHARTCAGGCGASPTSASAPAAAAPWPSTPRRSRRARARPRLRTRVNASRIDDRARSNRFARGRSKAKGKIAPLPPTDAQAAAGAADEGPKLRLDPASGLTLFPPGLCLLKTAPDPARPEAYPYPTTRGWRQARRKIFGRVAFDRSRSLQRKNYRSIFFFYSRVRQVRAVDGSLRMRPWRLPWTSGSIY